MRYLRLLTLLTVIIGTSGGCGSGEPSSAIAASAESSTFDTPQAAFDALRAAADKEDWAGAARLLVPDCQAMMAFPLIMQASFMTGGEPEKEQSLDALLKKHGINLEDDEPPAGVDPTDPSAMMQAMVAPIADLPAFLSELSAWMKENGEASDRDGFMKLGELNEVDVDGDSATATASMDRGEMPIEFRRVNGSWLVHLPLDGPEDREMSGTDESNMDDPSSPEIGTLSIGEQAYKLRHAIAYSSKFFDEPCTTVFLTAKAIPDRKLSELKEILAREGNDDGFNVWDAQLKLKFDESGELTFINSWADNVSLGTSASEVAAEIEVEDGCVKGKAAKTEGEEESDFTFRFDVTFDTELIGTEAK